MVSSHYQPACALWAPYGLYQLTAVPSPLPRGILVLVPVPQTMQGVWSTWLPLLKPVAAVTGETVCVREGALWVGQQWYGPVLREARGRLVPHLDGCVRLQAGEVFLASGVPGSLDSRSFGPVPVAALTAQAMSLVTWEDRCEVSR